MAENETFDYIVVGGGTAGCVLASRLSERQPELSVLVVEAGPDVKGRAHVDKPLEAALLTGSDIDWSYKTVPQTHLDGKSRFHSSAKALSGGVVLNAGGWIRGDALDYADWARLAGDDRWSYRGLLPYFKKSEKYVDKTMSPEHHGFDGPMHVTSVSGSGRKYPLREVTRKAWLGVGNEMLADANDGAPLGLAELEENRRDGLRQLTSVVYPLDKARVMLSTLVRRILFDENKTAIGIELVNNQQIHLKSGGEVLLCAGAYRSPQTLLLSGVGDSAQLQKHGIKTVVENSNVGRNFHDHAMIFRYWKLREPEKGVAMGSEALADPVFTAGNPADWLATMTVPAEGLMKAISQDEGQKVGVDHPNVQGPRCHLEMNVLYAAFGGEQIGLEIPMDGATIMNYCLATLPSSRGTVTLASANPADNPIIDPNYCATEADKYVMREGWRIMSRLMLETPEGKALVSDEVVPEGHKTLQADAADADIDARIKIGAITCHHPAGTNSMGKVVDASLNVVGAKKLRVIDASVIPVPLAAHYQAPVFALAEQAVDIILDARRA